MLQQETRKSSKLSDMSGAIGQNHPPSFQSLIQTVTWHTAARHHLRVWAPRPECVVRGKPPPCDYGPWLLEEILRLNPIFRSHFWFHLNANKKDKTIAASVLTRISSVAAAEDSNYWKTVKNTSVSIDMWPFSLNVGSTQIISQTLILLLLTPRQHQMCIHPQLKIVPNKCTTFSCLSGTN